MSAGRPSTTTIYGLTCPVTDRVRYVGKANDPSKRLEGHLAASRSRNTPLYRWIRELGDQNQRPGLRIIETVEFETWQDREIKWIAHYRTRGQLLNVAKGGNEPHCDAVTRAANGRKLNQHLSARSTAEKKMHKDKKMLANIHRSLTVRGDVAAAERIAGKMRALADRFPEHFHCWATI